MFPTVRGCQESQEILSKCSGKVREFYIPKSEKNKRVRESEKNQSTRVQKLTEMQKKI